MNDAAKRLLTDLGATKAVDPTTLTGRVSRRFSMLARHFLYLANHAESRDATGEDSSITRGNMLAVALALRVLLRPEVQEILKEECAKDDQYV